MNVDIDIDISVLLRPGNAEDRHKGYLEVFRKVAEIPLSQRVTVVGAPWSWVPLLEYLKARCPNPVVFFDYCKTVRAAIGHRKPNHPLDRTEVEVLCGFRPETAEALRKCDAVWQTERIGNERRTEFIVTNNGSLNRKEVLAFIEQLHQYTPGKRKVVLVSDVLDRIMYARKAVLDMLPEDYYLCSVSGVMGLVPYDLWPSMPQYEAGVHDEWRVFNIVRDYFARNEHDKIVMYCDYYSLAVFRALESISQVDRVVSINPVKTYHERLDLGCPDRMKMLLKELQGAVGTVS